MGNAKLILLAAALAALSARGGEDDGWEELFNGRDLSGWRVVGGEAKFSVEDGCIVGTGVPSNIGINTFVATEREFSDFDLRVEFLCESGNSGVQFRSADRECEYAPRRKVFGYQAEITSGGGATGRIYDEERRGYRHGVIWLDANTPKERAALAAESFVKGGWNEMRVRCEGPRLRTWLNGNLVADVLDDVDAKGFVALQVHVQRPPKAGEEFKPMRVRFRRVRVKELAAPRAACAAVPIDQQMARKAFDQKGDNELVEIVMDGRRVLRLNGMEIYDSANPAPAADAAGKNKEAK